MSEQVFPIALQIKAVEAAKLRYLALMDKDQSICAEVGLLAAVLEEAAETLRTLDLAEEVA